MSESDKRKNLCNVCYRETSCKDSPKDCNLERFATLNVNFDYVPLDNSLIIRTKGGIDNSYWA